jgi:hypothetical protein
VPFASVRGVELVHSWRSWRAAGDPGSWLVQRPRLARWCSALVDRRVTRAPSPVLVSPMYDRAGIGQGGVAPGSLVSKGGQSR